MESTALVLSAVVILLFLLGCATPQGGGSVIISNHTDDNITQKNQTTHIVINVSKGCGAINDTQLRDNCYLTRVTKNSSEDVSLCYNIMNEKLRDRCIYLLALEKIELCGMISQSMDLRDDCYYAHAENSGNGEICGSIENPELKNMCNLMIRLRKCEGLKEQDKTECTALQTGDPTVCADAIDPDGCYVDVAMNTSNSSVCRYIGNPVNNKGCEAIISGNYDVCLDLEFNTSEDACYQVVAEETNNRSICAKAVTETYINSCYQTLALMNDLPSLCAKLVRETQRDSCYYVVAKEFNRHETCNNVIEKSRRDICRVEIARALSDPSICNTIESNYYRNYQCYSVLIASNSYPITFDDCMKIPEQNRNWKDECFLRMAKETGNSSICSLILTESVKDRCS